MYNSQQEDRKAKSWMWTHTESMHGGIIGPEEGIADYRYKLLRTHRDNLSRQVSEGYRQSKMEELQAQKMLTCCNSKLDFIQPLMTHLTVNRGSRNAKPDRPQVSYSQQLTN